uniref:Ubiquitin-like protease family profile domain-containing protein n=1 Tax=Cajanus cajan TaxID=3821 RepID=A0A151SX86_CAJCA|nr:hypothetical protein KK1_014852 [Cajanus cajan]
MCNDLEKPLYPNCTKFTRLSAILRLFNLKARNGWSDKSFTELLELLKEMLPEGNTLPNCNYEAEKVLCPMGLEYKKIHACPNDCMLYHGEFEGLHQCLRCGLSRYKKKQDDSDYDVSTKDCLQWKKIDSMFPNFGKEPRNVRLGLATDSTKHSSWPVLLTIYNLPPCPLVEDLKMLWIDDISEIGYYNFVFLLTSIFILHVINSIYTNNLQFIFVLIGKYGRTKTWDIPNTERMRRKTLSIVAERWRQYKTTLTNKYIFGEKKGQFPGDETEKRKKAQETQAKNETYVVTSRGGYEWLKKKIIKEKAMKRQASQDDNIVSDPPAPPGCHELWKVSRDVVVPPKAMLNHSTNLTLIKKLWRLVPDMEDDNRPKQVPWAPEVFGFCSNVPLYISQSDISEITNGHCMLNISISQLWLLFIHKLSVDKGNDHIYGFLEPELIQKIGNKTEEIQAYIQNWMSDSNKKVYLAPYFSNSQWQLLIICPMDNISVCICSMHKPPLADFKQLLDKAMEGYHILKGSKLKKKMLWVSLKSHKQKGNYECGYYVMKAMHTIVDSQIVSGWTEVRFRILKIFILSLHFIMF